MTKLSNAQTEYDAAYYNFHKVDAAINEIEQFADRQAELNADARYDRAEKRLTKATEALHAAGGRTNEEKRAANPPSVRFEIRDQGDQLGLGNSWGIYEKDSDTFIIAFSTPDKCEAYLIKGDEAWWRRRAIAKRREQERKDRENA